eukprot:Em0019g813a
MCSSWTVDNFTAGDSEGCVVSVCRSKSRKAVSLIKASIAICVWHSTAVFLMGWNDTLILGCTTLAVIFCLVSSFIFSVYKETVVILSSVGVHVTKRYWSGRSTSSFIPHNLVRSVVLNEGIALQRVIFYLALLVGPDTGSVTRIIPLFTTFSPRLAELETAYHSLKHVLH